MGLNIHVIDNGGLRHWRQLFTLRDPVSNWAPQRSRQLKRP